MPIEAWCHPEQGSTRASNRCRPVAFRSDSHPAVRALGAHPVLVRCFEIGPPGPGGSPKIRRLPLGFTYPYSSDGHIP